MSLLELRNVSKSYGENTVLDKVNFCVEEGEFIAIVGYSGSGKTTLMNLISGLDQPDSGEALLEGRVIEGPGPDRALVFQNYSLLPWLTVSQNIALAVNQVFPGWSKLKRDEHIRKHIEMVKLGHAADKLPSELSGGMRQRVSVARALSMDSRILLLDEPLSALDALTRANLQEDISEIWMKQRKTVIWITNDPDEALLLADKVFPLLPTVPATLGAPIEVKLKRPRDRKTLHHQEEFKVLRQDLIEQLLEAKSKQRSVRSAKLILPDILPEDISNGQSLSLLIRRGPLRRSDVQAREDIEIVS